MKKVLIMITSIIMLLAIVFACWAICFTHSPEYVLMEICDDVKNSGIDGLRPHLTENALEMIDTVSAIGENKLVGSIIGFLDRSGYVDILKSKIQEMHWEVADILKSSDRAEVILAFHDDDYLSGTIRIVMIYSAGEWKIDGLALPQIHTINGYCCFTYSAQNTEVNLC